MIIAIIDDGVSTYSTPNLIFSLEVNECGLLDIFKGYIDPISHGSICSAIIQKYNPNVQIGSIKVLDNKTKKGDCFKLEKAILWCINNNVKIIHLSLGTVSNSDYSPLLKAVNEAYEHGIIIISAFKNGSSVSYPASFSNVIGVQCDPKLQGDTYYARTSNYHGIDFSASAIHELPELQSTPYCGLTPMCNSYAAPVITAKIYANLIKYPFKNFDQIKEDLNKSSAIFTPLYQPRLYKQIDWVNIAKILIIGDSLVSPIDMQHCRINEIIYLDSNSAIKKTLNLLSNNSPVALYSTHTLNIKEIIIENMPPLIFLNKIDMQYIDNLPNRIFIPTIIEDYATEQAIPNDRPVITILHDTNFSSSSLCSIFKEMFESINFDALFFSEYPIDILLGAIYIDNAQLYQYHCIKMADQLNTELFIIHCNLNNLQMIKPDVIICNASTAELLYKRGIKNTSIILLDHYEPSELFKATCDIICE